jgi:hypothetical protein
MSLYIEFDAHSWYKGFAIKDQRLSHTEADLKWYAVTANGMTGYLVEFEADTLKDLKKQITDYRGN